MARNNDAKNRGEAWFVPRTKPLSLFFRSAGVFCAAPQLTECVEEAMKCVASTTEEAFLSVSGKQPTQMKATTRVLNSKLKLLKTKF